jgi:hypothetical protein
VSWRPDHLTCGVTYWPAEVGPYLWHEFDAERTRRDMRRIAARGFAMVRVPLTWDAFVPSPRQVNRYRLRDLETLLQAAQAASLRVVPVLFAQSVGDCVMLPRYAVARDRPWPGVRVISDGIVERGGPRDVWADPLMLEVESLWLEEMLRAFANHPALLAWDLGHDPATTCRPRRIAELAMWAEMMGARVRATQDPCWMTLGAADVLTARGVRLAAVAPHVDALGIAVEPQAMALAGEALDVARVLFVLRVTQRLAGDDAPPVLCVTGLTAEPVVAGEARPPSEIPPAAAAGAVRHAGALLEQLPDAGVPAALAPWTDLGLRTLDAPPFDRRPWLACSGIAEAGGDLKPHGEVWSAAARRDTAAGPPQPWPAAPFDVDGWYENLPDASNDLFARFRAETDVATQ